MQRYAPLTSLSHLGVWLTKMVNGYREQQRHAHNLRQMPRFDHLKAESTEAGISTHGVIGVATGVFFTLYSVNGIVGSAVVLILLQNGTTVIGMIYSMSALAAMGAAMMVGGACHERVRVMKISHSPIIAYRPQSPCCQC